MIKITDNENMIDWSLLLINKKFISEYHTISEIGFLMKSTPYHLLKPSVQFILF